MPRYNKGMSEYIADEIILNGVIYRRVMATDCVEPKPQEGTFDAEHNAVPEIPQPGPDESLRWDAEKAEFVRCEDLPEDRPDKALCKNKNCGRCHPPGTAVEVEDMNPLNWSREQRDKIEGIWHRGTDPDPLGDEDALFDALDTAPRQGESRDKFKLYDKSIKISSKPSALRRFAQRLAIIFTHKQPNLPINDWWE